MANNEYKAVIQFKDRSLTDASALRLCGLDLLRYRKCLPVSLVVPVSSNYTIDI